MASAVRCRHPSSCDADLSGSVFYFAASLLQSQLSARVPLRCFSFPFFTSSIHYPSFVLSFSINQLVHSAKSFEISLISPHSATSAPSPTASPSVGFAFLVFGSVGSSFIGCGCHFRHHRWLFTFLVLNALLPLTAWILRPRHCFILVHLTLSSSPSTSNSSVVCLVSLVHLTGFGNTCAF